MYKLASCQIHTQNKQGAAYQYMQLAILLS